MGDVFGVPLFGKVDLGSEHGSDPWARLHWCKRGMAFLGTPSTDSSLYENT